MSWEAFLKKIGFSRPMLTSIRTKKSLPTITFVERVADLLNMSVDDLIGRDFKPGDHDLREDYDKVSDTKPTADVLDILRQIDALDDSEIQKLVEYIYARYMKVGHC